MNDIILIISIGIIGILVLKGFEILSRDIQRLHHDVRRCIELGFWAQKRERKLLKK